MPVYSKPYLPIPGQIELLQTRGMIVTDARRAGDCLKRVGYYHLSAYWHPFRQTEMMRDVSGKLTVQYLDAFKTGTQFKDAFKIYFLTRSCAC